MLSMFWPLLSWPWGSSFCTNCNNHSNPFLYCISLMIMSRTVGIGFVFRFLRWGLSQFLELCILLLVLGASQILEWVRMFGVRMGVVF